MSVGGISFPSDFGRLRCGSCFLSESIAYEGRCCSWKVIYGISNISEEGERLGLHVKIV